LIHTNKNVACKPGETVKADQNENTGAQCFSSFLPFSPGSFFSAVLYSCLFFGTVAQNFSFGFTVEGQNEPGYEER